jgi:hypothetical protein
MDFVEDVVALCIMPMHSTCHFVLDPNTRASCEGAREIRWGLLSRGAHRHAVQVLAATCHNLQTAHLDLSSNPFVADQVDDTDDDAVKGQAY